MNELTAVSPADGRYRSKTTAVADYFSEAAFIRYRVRVEIEYFIALFEIPLQNQQPLSEENKKNLRSLYTDFNTEEAQKVKTIEATVNHDVKAVEYYLKDRFDKIDLTDRKEFVHFGLTSQDINNTALPLMLKECLENILIPEFDQITNTLKNRSEQWADIPMLSRTHGQPASPTRLGKEFLVFIERLENQLKMLKQVPFTAKFGGAVGNFNAHHVAYPDIDWHEFSDRLVSKLGLQRCRYTTQIEHYDHLAAIFDNLKRINTILIDLCRDSWHYISLNYFTQKINAAETGSSAMPHKVNPIDFENAEGNLGISNALFEHFSAKLPISRLQRDLTDSTVLRNIGVPIAHTLIALKSLLKGFGKLTVNSDTINRDLEENAAVVAEGIQTVLRREGYPEPYEALKALTRTNQPITLQAISEFIDSLKISTDLKKELKAITPFNYIGI